MSGAHHGPRRRSRALALNITGLAISLALALGQFGLVSAGAIDRDRDGAFSSDTEVISDDGGSSGSGGAVSGSGQAPQGSITNRGESGAEGPRPLHGGSGAGSGNFKAADPASYNHATGAGGDSSDFETTLNGADFECGDKVVFFVTYHPGKDYNGAAIPGIAFSFAKDTTGATGAGYTGVGSPTVATGDSLQDDNGTAASLSSVSIGSTATTHTLSFTLNGADGDLDADGQADTIVVRFVATLGCTPGTNPTGQIQAKQTGGGGADTVNLNVAGLPVPAALQISKAVTGGGSADVGFGANISWTITVTNSGNAAATNVNVSDTLPTGFTLVSATPSQGSCTGTSTVSCSLGTIPGPGSATVVIIATAPSTCDPYTNTATGTFGAAAPITIPPATPGANSVNGNVTGCVADVKISKAVTGGGSADVGFGANISWTITVTNSGNAAATNVNVSDTLPTGFTLVSATPSQGSCTGTSTVSCSLGTIPGPGSATVVIIATAPSTCDPYTNIATGTFGTGTTITPNVNSVSGNVTGCAPSLTIGKSGPAAVSPGGSITWTVTVTNSGNADAIGVLVSDTLPTGFTFASSNPGAPTCTEAGGTVTCTVDVPKGAATSISITATAPSTCGPFTNTASLVRAGGSASSSGDVTGCGPTPVPSIVTFKSVDTSPVSPGDPIGFRITVRSNGTAHALQVELSDTIPTIPGVSSWTINGGSGAGLCSLAGLVLTCNFGNMAPGAQFDVHISSAPTTSDSCGSYTNTAVADALNTASSQAQASVRVDCPPAVSGIDVTKTGPATAKVGDTVTYNFTVALAPGSPDLTGVTITDPICDPGTLAGPTGDDGDNVLEAGETWGFSCTHVVTASDPDPLPNTVTVCATGPAGATVCDSGNHEIDIIHPAIDVEKEADPISGTVGTVITYTYFVTNSGDVPLFNVSVDDDILGPICDIAVLPPNTTVTCTGTYTIPAGSPPELTNIVIAGGTDPAGDLVEDQDDFTITIVAGETITKSPPGGVAFTGPTTAIPFATLALALLTLGSGLLWLGRRRGRERTDGPEA